jgi:hypothetical protein
MPDNRQQLALVAAALDEVRPLIRRLHLIGRFPHFAGESRQSTIDLTIVGPGADRAVAGVSRVLDEYRPQRIILLGFAGGLDPDWRPGRLLVCRRVIDGRGAAYDLTGAVPAPAADTPDPPDTPDGHDPATTLLTVAQAVDTVSAKALHWRSCGAVAADMESWHIAALAARRGVHLTVVRAICDPADMALPPGIGRWLTPDGRAAGWTVAGDLFRHPGLLRTMPGLIRASRAAAGALADWAANELATGPAARETIPAAGRPPGS